MAQTVTIRSARPGDLTRVDDLIARAYRRLLRDDYPPSAQVLAIPLISKANPGLMRTPTYFVAEAEDAILAVGGWTMRDPHGGRSRPTEGHVRAFATDPDEVRRGLGSALMAAVLASARAAGVTRLTSLSTRTAVPFYAAHGFRRIGERRVGLRPGIEFPAVEMRRAPLSPL